jgi:hypothetical protein
MSSKFELADAATASNKVLPELTLSRGQPLILELRQLQSSLLSRDGQRPTQPYYESLRDCTFWLWRVNDSHQLGTRFFVQKETTYQEFRE